VPRARTSILTLAARAAGWLGLLLAVPALAADPLRYEVEIPDGEAVTYSVPLDVRVAGPIVVRAEGAGRRAIALRLEPPAGPVGAVRRSGLPPLTLETSAEPEANEIGTWRLVLRAQPGTGSSTLHVRIELPDSVAHRVPPAPTPDVSTPPRAPATEWAAERRQTAPAEHQAFLAAAEQFAVASPRPGHEVPADACRWQAGLEDYLAASAAALRLGVYPPRPTRELLASIAAAVDSVASLRTTDDPLLAGPAPRDPQLARAWRRARAERLAPLEEELDELRSAVQRGHAPELRDASWPGLLVTCLTACERFFDERALTGERRATNRDLATAQWPRIVAATQALRALAVVEPATTARAHP